MNYSSDNSVNPGDIRKLISTPGKSKASPNKKDNRKVFSNEVTTTGNIYFEVGQHEIYHMKKKNLLVHIHLQIMEPIVD